MDRRLHIQSSGFQGSGEEVVEVLQDADLDPLSECESSDAFADTLEGILADQGYENVRVTARPNSESQFIVSRSRPLDEIMAELEPKQQDLGVPEA